MNRTISKPSGFGCTNLEISKLSNKCRREDEIFIENVCFRMFRVKNPLSVHEMVKKCSSLNYTLADFPLIKTSSFSNIFNWFFASLKDNLIANIPWPVYSKYAKLNDLY